MFHNTVMVQESILLVIGGIAITGLLSWGAWVTKRIFCEDVLQCKLDDLASKLDKFMEKCDKCHQL